MAPITRSRAEGPAGVSKKRVAVYTEDGSSSEEEASNRKPKKRAKTDKDVKSVAKKPAAVGGRTRKRGRLNALPEMPLDILEEIFSLLDPADLIRVARTTKAFRRLLLVGDHFSHLWKASWSRMEGYPSCPEDIPLLRWLQLLFGGPYCQVCAAPSVQRIFFSIRARICKNCLRNTLVYAGSTSVGNIRPPDLQWYIPTVYEGRNMYAYEKDVEGLKMAVSSALEDTDPAMRSEAIKAVTESYAKAYASRLSHQRKCDAWQKRMMENRKDDLGERRANRRKDILRRLEELGYMDADASGIWNLKDVYVSKPLTDRTWGILLRTLLPTLNRSRVLRLQYEYQNRLNCRLQAARKAYTELLRSGTVKPRDIPYLPHPKACVQFGPLAALIEEDEEASSADWKQRLDIAVLDSLPLMQEAFEKHQTELASLITCQADRTALDLHQSLALATSVFVVPGLWSRPEASFGLEAVARSARRPCRYSSTAGSYSASRLPCVVQPTPESVFTAVREIFRLLELNDMTTILELDALDPCFTCMTCKVQHDWTYLYHEGRHHELRYRQAMNWRDVVTHFLESHKDDAADVQIHLLTNSERAAVGAEGTLLALKRRRNGDTLVTHAFGCCHCTESLVLPDFADTGDPKYSSLDDIRLHAKGSHDIEVPKEGVDYFQDPLAHRGVLGGILLPYCLVEEAKEEAKEEAAADAVNTSLA